MEVQVRNRRGHSVLVIDQLVGMIGTPAAQSIMARVAQPPDNRPDT
jgi:hypothetical protein